MVQRLPTARRPPTRPVAVQRLAANRVEKQLRQCQCAVCNAQATCPYPHHVEVKLNSLQSECCVLVNLVKLNGTEALNVAVRALIELSVRLRAACMCCAVFVAAICSM